MTAKLWADQKSKTVNRASYSKALGRRTREALESVGLVYVPRRAIRDRLEDLGDNPAEGLTASN